MTFSSCHLPCVDHTPPPAQVGKAPFLCHCLAESKPLTKVTPIATCNGTPASNCFLLSRAQQGWSHLPADLLNTTGLVALTPPASVGTCSPPAGSTKFYFHFYTFSSPHASRVLAGRISTRSTHTPLCASQPTRQFFRKLFLCNLDKHSTRCWVFSENN